MFIAGSYGISIKFGGVPIPEGDYEVEVTYYIMYYVIVICLLAIIYKVLVILTVAVNVLSYMCYRLYLRRIWLLMR